MNDPLEQTLQEIDGLALELDPYIEALINDDLLIEAATLRGLQVKVREAVNHYRKEMGSLAL